MTLATSSKQRPAHADVLTAQVDVLTEVVEKAMAAVRSANEAVDLVTAQLKAGTAFLAAVDNDAPPLGIDAHQAREAFRDALTRNR